MKFATAIETFKAATDNVIIADINDSEYYPVKKKDSGKKNLGYIVEHDEKAYFCPKSVCTITQADFKTTPKVDALDRGGTSYEEFAIELDSKKNITTLVEKLESVELKKAKKAPVKKAKGEAKADLLNKFLAGEITREEYLALT